MGDSNVVFISSDEEDEKTLWKSKATDEHFQRLFQKVKRIIFNRSRRYYISDGFPYGRFVEYTQELETALATVSSKNTRRFIWRCAVRWLVPLKNCIREPIPLSEDWKYNYIVTNIMAQYINFKCEYYHDRDPATVQEQVEEILRMLEVAFSCKTEFVLITFLKIRIRYEYRDILIPLFRAYLLSPFNYDANDFGNYVCLVMCYRQWKRLMRTKESRETINEYACGQIERLMGTYRPIDLTLKPVLPWEVPKATPKNEIFFKLHHHLVTAKTTKNGTRLLLASVWRDWHSVLKNYFKLYEQYNGFRIHLEPETPGLKLPDMGNNNDDDVILISNEDDVIVIPDDDDLPSESGSISNIKHLRVIEKLKRLAESTPPKSLEEQEKTARALKCRHCTGNSGTAMAVNQHLSKDCDISRLSKSLLSSSIKSKKQFSCNCRSLGDSFNENNNCIVIETTDDDSDNDDNYFVRDEALDDFKDKLTIDLGHNQIVEKRENDHEESVKPPASVSTFIEELKRRAIEMEPQNNNARPSSPIVLSSDDDEPIIVEPPPARREEVNQNNVIVNEIIDSSSEDEVTERQERHIPTPRPTAPPAEPEERPLRREKPRCITGEVSSTTSLGCTSTPNADNAPIQNESLLENAREVGTLSAVHTSSPNGNGLSATEYSDISDDDLDICLSESRQAPRQCWSKFSKVVEEATSSTSEPLMRGANEIQENVIFSVAPNRRRRSTSSSPCPTRTNSPSENSRLISPSSTIRTRRIRHYRAKNLSRIPVRTFSTVSRVISEDGELPTCSRYIRRIPNLEISFKGHEAGLKLVKRTTDTHFSEKATCSRYVKRKKSDQKIKEKKECLKDKPGSLSAAKQQTSSVKNTCAFVSPSKEGNQVSQADNSDLDKFLEDITTHIGASTEIDDQTAAGLCLATENGRLQINSEDISAKEDDLLSECPPSALEPDKDVSVNGDGDTNMDVSITKDTLPNVKNQLTHKDPVLEHSYFTRMQQSRNCAKEASEVVSSPESEVIKTKENSQMSELSDKDKTESCQMLTLLSAENHGKITDKTYSENNEDCSYFQEERRDSLEYSPLSSVGNFILEDDELIEEEELENDEDIESPAYEPIVAELPKKPVSQNEKLIECNDNVVSLEQPKPITAEKIRNGSSEEIPILVAGDTVKCNESSSTKSDDLRTTEGSESLQKSIHSFKVSSDLGVAATEKAIATEHNIEESKEMSVPTTDSMCHTIENNDPVIICSSTAIKPFPIETSTDGEPPAVAEEIEVEASNVSDSVPTTDTIKSESDQYPLTNSDNAPNLNNVSENDEGQFSEKVIAEGKVVDNQLQCSANEDLTSALKCKQTLTDSIEEDFKDSSHDLCPHDSPNKREIEMVVRVNEPSLVNEKLIENFSENACLAEDSIIETSEVSKRSDLEDVIQEKTTKRTLTKQTENTQNADPPALTAHPALWPVCSPEISSEKEKPSTDVVLECMANTLNKEQVLNLNKSIHITERFSVSPEPSAVSEPVNINPASDNQIIPNVSAIADHASTNEESEVETAKLNQRTECVAKYQVGSECSQAVADESESNESRTNVRLDLPNTFPSDEQQVVPNLPVEIEPADTKVIEEQTALREHIDSDIPESNKELLPTGFKSVLIQAREQQTTSTFCTSSETSSVCEPTTDSGDKSVSDEVENTKHCDISAKNDLLTEKIIDDISINAELKSQSTDKSEKSDKPSSIRENSSETVSRWSTLVSIPLNGQLKVYTRKKTETSFVKRFTEMKECENSSQSTKKSDIPSITLSECEMKSENQKQYSGNKSDKATLLTVPTEYSTSEQFLHIAKASDTTPEEPAVFEIAESLTNKSQTECEQRMPFRKRTSSRNSSDQSDQQATTSLEIRNDEIKTSNTMDKLHTVDLDYRESTGNAQYTEITLEQSTATEVTQEKRSRENTSNNMSSDLSQQQSVPSFTNISLQEEQTSTLLRPLIETEKVFHSTEDQIPGDNQESQLNENAPEIEEHYESEKHESISKNSIDLSDDVESESEHSSVTSEEKSIVENIGSEIEIVATAQDEISKTIAGQTENVPEPKKADDQDPPNCTPKETMKELQTSVMTRQTRDNSENEQLAISVADQNVQISLQNAIITRDSGSKTEMLMAEHKDESNIDLKKQDRTLEQPEAITTDKVSESKLPTPMAASTESDENGKTESKAVSEDQSNKIIKPPFCLMQSNESELQDPKLTTKTSLDTKTEEESSALDKSTSFQTEMQSKDQKDTTTLNNKAISAKTPSTPTALLMQQDQHSHQSKDPKDTTTLNNKAISTKTPSTPTALLIQQDQHSHQSKDPKDTTTLNNKVVSTKTCNTPTALLTRQDQYPHTSTRFNETLSESSVHDKRKCNATRAAKEILSIEDYAMVKSCRVSRENCEVQSPGSNIQQIDTYQKKKMGKHTPTQAAVVPHKIQACGSPRHEEKQSARNEFVVQSIPNAKIGGNGFHADSYSAKYNKANSSENRDFFRSMQHLSDKQNRNANKYPPSLMQQHSKSSFAPFARNKSKTPFGEQLTYVTSIPGVSVISQNTVDTCALFADRAVHGVPFNDSVHSFPLRNPESEKSPRYVSPKDLEKHNLNNSTWSKAVHGLGRDRPSQPSIPKLQDSIPYNSISQYLASENGCTPPLLRGAPEDASYGSRIAKTSARTLTATDKHQPTEPNSCIDYSKKNKSEPRVKRVEMSSKEELPSGREEGEIEINGHMLGKRDSVKPELPASSFGSWSNAAEIQFLLKLRQTQSLYTGEDSNQSIQVQVTAEDLGDPMSSFDGDTENYSPAYESYTPSKENSTDCNTNANTPYPLSGNSAEDIEDQEVSKITSQEIPPVTYNAYPDDSGTPVMDEKDAEEIETSPCQGKIISLSVLKGIPELPQFPTMPTEVSAYPNQADASQPSPNCLPVLRSPQANNLNSLSAGKMSKEPEIEHKPLPSLIQVNLNSAFVEPSPKPKPAIEIDSEYQKTPLKMRLKRRISQCADINEEFNLGPSEPVKLIDILAAQALERKHNESAMERVDNSKCTPVKASTMPELDEDQNLLYQETWYKKLGKTKSVDKASTRTTQTPENPDALAILQLSENCERSTSATLEDSPLFSKNEGRRRKPIRVRKLTDLLDKDSITESDAAANICTVQSAFHSPLTASPLYAHTGIEQPQQAIDTMIPSQTMEALHTKYNPEDIKAATILSDMLKTSYKIDENLKYRTVKPPKARKRSKVKFSKQTPLQFRRMTRSTSQLMEQSPSTPVNISQQVSNAPSTTSKSPTVQECKDSKPATKTSPSTSIWRQDETKEILRTLSEGDKTAPFKEQPHLYPFSNCSSDSDDVGKLVIDTDEGSSDANKKVTSQPSIEIQRNDDILNKIVQIGTISIIPQLTASPATETVHPSKYKSFRNAALEVISVMKLTPETDVFPQVQNVNQESYPNAIEDDVAALYPIVQLTELTPKSKSKRTPRKSPARSSGRKSTSEPQKTKKSKKSPKIEKVKNSLADAKAGQCSQLYSIPCAVPSSGESPSKKSEKSPKLGVKTIEHDEISSLQSEEKSSREQTPPLELATNSQEYWLKTFLLMRKSPERVEQENKAKDSPPERAVTAIPTAPPAEETQSEKVLVEEEKSSCPQTKPTLEDKVHRKKKSLTTVSKGLSNTSNDANVCRGGKEPKIEMQTKSNSKKSDLTESLECQIGINKVDCTETQILSAAVLESPLNEETHSCSAATASLDDSQETEKCTQNSKPNIQKPEDGSQNKISDPDYIETQILSAPDLESPVKKETQADENETTPSLNESKSQMSSPTDLEVISSIGVVDFETPDKNLEEKAVNFNVVQEEVNSEPAEDKLQTCDKTAAESIKTPHVNENTNQDVESDENNAEKAKESEEEHPQACSTSTPEMDVTVHKTVALMEDKPSHKLSPVESEINLKTLDNNKMDCENSNQSEESSNGCRSLEIENLETKLENEEILTVTQTLPVPSSETDPIQDSDKTTESNESSTKSTEKDAQKQIDSEDLNESSASSDGKSEHSNEDAVCTKPPSSPTVIDDIPKSNKAQHEDGALTATEEDRTPFRRNCFMQIRRLSIDENNLKMTLRMSKEVAEKHNKHSKKHSKKTHRRFSTGVYDVSRCREGMKNEIAAITEDINVFKAKTLNYTDCQPAEDQISESSLQVPESISKEKDLLPASLTDSKETPLPELKLPPIDSNEIRNSVSDPEIEVSPLSSEAESKVPKPLATNNEVSTSLLDDHDESEDTTSETSPPCDEAGAQLRDEPASVSESLPICDDAKSEMNVEHKVSIVSESLPICGEAKSEMNIEPKVSIAENKPLHEEAETELNKDVESAATMCERAETQLENDSKSEVDIPGTLPSCIEAESDTSINGEFKANDRKNVPLCGETKSEVSSDAEPKVNISETPPNCDEANVEKCHDTVHNVNEVLPLCDEAKSEGNSKGHKEEEVQKNVVGNLQKVVLENEELECVEIEIETNPHPVVDTTVLSSESKQETPTEEKCLENIENISEEPPVIKNQSSKVPKDDKLKSCKRPAPKSLKAKQKIKKKRLEKMSPTIAKDENVFDNTAEKQIPDVARKPLEAKGDNRSDNSKDCAKTNKASVSKVQGSLFSEACPKSQSQRKSNKINERRKLVVSVKRMKFLDMKQKDQFIDSKVEPTPTQVEKNIQRRSLDCNHSRPSSPVQLRNRSKSTDMQRSPSTEQQSKKLKPFKLNISKLEACHKTLKEMNCTEPTTSYEAKLYDESERLAEQLNSFIKKILEDSDDSSTNMLLTSRPQIFDRVPKDIFAGNGDMSDNMDSKYYSPILPSKPYDIILKSTSSEEGRLNVKTVNEEESVKSNSDTKEKETESESTENPTNSEENSAPDLELDASEIPHIPDVGIICEEDSIPDLCAETECLSEVLDDKIDKEVLDGNIDTSTPFIRDYMISGNYRSNNYLDLPLLSGFEGINLLDVQNQFPNNGDGDGLLVPKVENLADVEIDFGSELFLYSGCIQSQDSSGSSEEKRDTECETPTTAIDMYLNNNHSEATVTETQLNGNEIPIASNVAGQLTVETSTGIISTSPPTPVEVSTDVGFESYSELLAESTPFFLPSVVNNKESNETEGPKAAEPVKQLVDILESSVTELSQNESKYNKQIPNASTPRLADSESSVQIEKEVNRESSGKTKRDKIKILPVETPKTEDVMCAPVKLKSRPIPFWKIKKLETKSTSDSSSSIENKISPTPVADEIPRKLSTPLVVNPAAVELNFDAAKTGTAIDSLYQEVNVETSQLCENATKTNSSPRPFGDTLATIVPIGEESTECKDLPLISQLPDLDDIVEIELETTPSESTIQSNETFELPTEVAHNIELTTEVDQNEEMQPAITSHLPDLSDIVESRHQFDTDHTYNSIRCQEVQPNKVLNLPELNAVDNSKKHVDTNNANTSNQDFSQVKDEQQTTESKESLVSQDSCEPPTKKARNETASKLSIDDLFDRLKRESPVNPLMHKVKYNLKKTSSFDTDDTSSRDSVVGLLAAPESPHPVVANVASPAPLMRESPKPNTAPSMPIITTPSRSDSYPEAKDNKPKSADPVSVSKTLRPSKSSTTKDKLANGIDHKNEKPIPSKELKRPLLRDDSEKHEVIQPPKKIAVKVPESTNPLKKVEHVQVPPDCSSKKTTEVTAKTDKTLERVKKSLPPTPAPPLKSDTKPVPRVTFASEIIEIPKVDLFLSATKSNIESPNLTQKPVKSILVSPSKHSASDNSTSRRLKHKILTSNSLEHSPPGYSSSHTQKINPLKCKSSPRRSSKQEKNNTPLHSKPEKIATPKPEHSSRYHSSQKPADAPEHHRSDYKKVPSTPTNHSKISSSNSASSFAETEMLIASLTAEIESLSSTLMRLPEPKTYAQHSYRKRTRETYEQKVQQLHELKKRRHKESERYSQSKSYSERQPFDNTANHKATVHNSQRESKEKYKETRRPYVNKFGELGTKNFQVSDPFENRLSNSCREAKRLPSWDLKQISAEEIIADLKMKKARKN